MTSALLSSGSSLILARISSSSIFLRDFRQDESEMPGVV
jgi:hypothetical protein